MLKVSQNILNHPAPVILAIKSKTYHGRYEKYTTTKNIWHFVESNTQLVVFILNEQQLFVFSQTKVLFIKENFHIDKEYIS